MSDATPNLKMPYILPSQAQKHVTHNEALQTLDALVHLAIEEERNSPPASPSEGARYLVSTPASDVWSGRNGALASFIDGAWTFIDPQEGFVAWFHAEGRLRIYQAGQWVTPALPDTASFSQLGINATADSTNRFSLSAAATLLNHAGSGHQLKINKASASDTASLLFQTNWSGRAEMGLAGNNNFSLKVCNDSGTWTTALTVNGDGRVTMPAGPAARAHRSTGTAAAVSGTQSGFSVLAAEQGGVTLGTAVAGGGNTLVVPASGLYHLSMTVSAVSSSGHAVSLMRNGATLLMTVNAPALAPLTVCGSGIHLLSAGDALTFSHSGTATLDHGAGRTEVSIAML